MKRLCLALLVVILTATAAQSHEMRPAFLDVQEMAPGQFDIHWKQPVRGDRRLRIDPVLPAHCASAGPVTPHRTATAYMRRWQVDCGPQGLEEQSLSVSGLERTLTDVFVRVTFQDGRTQNGVLRAGKPALTVSADANPSILHYVPIGIDHILEGLDHLLFVLGLLLLIARNQLLWTITAFTAAHSLTLGLSAMNLVHLPPGPVEAVIALSILLLAVEIVRSRTDPPGLTRRKPWLVAFAFGLLHGFGFAGALSEIGLPGDAKIAALFAFNLGVELGQIIIVAGALVLVAALRTLHIPRLSLARLGLTYAMGTMATVWTFERIAAL